MNCKLNLLFLLFIIGFTTPSTASINSSQNFVLQNSELKKETKGYFGKNLSNFKVDQLQSTNFVEDLSKRSAIARHFFNESSNTWRFVNDQLVQLEGIHPETNWITFEEYPINYIIRLINGSIYKFQDPNDLETFFSSINNNSLWGIGLESYNGLMGFYTDFSDIDWGHGQYLYYPRLKDGSLPEFNQPQYAIYPHLYVKAGSNWFDKLINNRSFYSGANNPRDYFTFFQDGNELGIKFQTDNVNIDGFEWNFTQGLKYNTTDRQFHLITDLVSLDRGWDDIGLGYEITASPQAENTPYEPDRFVLSNNTHSKIVNITNLWKANETITDPLNSLEILSQNNEAFRFDFEDMKQAGFTNSYLELHNQILPNNIEKKTLLAGMFGHGSVSQNELLTIDPTFSEKADVDAYDYWIQYQYDTQGYTENLGDSTNYGGFQTGAVDQSYNIYEAWNTSITGEIDTINNGAMTFYISAETVEASEYLAGGLYDSTDADHIFEESEVNGNESTVYNIDTYWNDTTFITEPTGNYSIDSTDITNLLDAWKTWHNNDPSDREFLPLKLYPGSGLDNQTTDYIGIDESSHATASQRPTLTFDYTLGGGDDPPELDSPANKTLEAGYNNENITWVPTERTNSPANYSIFRNGTNVQNGTWTNQTDIVINIDSINLTLAVFNFTIVINDTSSLEASDLVWITVQDTTSPTLNPPSDVSYIVDETGNWVNWTATDYFPMNYSVFRDGTNIQNGTWISGNPINVSVDGLVVGTYNYTIFVNDTSSNENTDLVWVTVSAEATTTAVAGTITNIFTQVVNEIIPDPFPIIADLFDILFVSWPFILVGLLIIILIYKRVS